MNKPNVSERDAFGIAISAMKQLLAYQTQDITKSIIKQSIDIVSKHATQLPEDQAKANGEANGGGTGEMESEG